MTSAPARPSDASALTPSTAEQLAARLVQMGPEQAAKALQETPDVVAVAALQRLAPGVASDVIAEIEPEHRARIFETGPRELTQQWTLNQTFPDDSIGRLMEPPSAVFRPTDTVGDVSRRVRDLVKSVFVTYCYVVDERGILLGLVTMRDLLVADDALPLERVMLRDPFTLRPATPLKDAMKQVLNRHYPVYPVCSEDGRLIGLVRGQAMFEEQAFEISAQPGRMVGVDKEERLATGWPVSLKFRHPWLQLNLLTAFVAAATVGIFQNTLDQIVILALFLPVLAGQSGNTGCQALAVTLRGMTLGELTAGKERALVLKEAWLGLLNGGLVGITAGLGMYVVARMQNHEAAFLLAVIVAMAMIGACVVSGISGAMIPMVLRKAGADPATASSIFLTTATDVVSMGMFLGLATLFLL